MSTIFRGFFVAIIFKISREWKEPFFSVLAGKKESRVLGKESDERSAISKKSITVESMSLAAY